MKIFTPLSVAVRFVIYASMIYGAAELVRLDAVFPMEDGYYGEISFTEIAQEVILLTIFFMYLAAGMKYRAVQPVTNLISLLLLASFIREFNFLISWWFYLVLPLLLLMIWMFIRDYSKIKPATAEFFTLSSSGWFLSGFLFTFLFSRLMGRSSFWRVLYDEHSYRIAKAAAEEGIELAGNVIMLISAIELFVFIRERKLEERA